MDNFLEMHRKRPPVALLAKILSEEKDDQLILDAAYCCKHVLSRLQNHLFINMSHISSQQQQATYDTCAERLGRFAGYRFTALKCDAMG